MSASTVSAPADLGPTGPGGVKRGKSAFIHLIKRARPWLNDFMVPYSKVGNAPFTDPAAFPWVAELLEELPAIQAEAARILQHHEAVPPFRDFAPGHERIAPDVDDWRSFFLWGYGYPIGNNLARCPDTARAITKVPGLVSALYSVVAPGAHIRRHRGVTKAIMTLHICLKAPVDAENCRMDADGVQVVFREGHAVVLDDTFPHEVWNEATGPRVNLLIQFRRPMRQPGRVLASLIVGIVRRSSFVQRARRNLGYWEEVFAAAERG